MPLKERKGEMAPLSTGNISWYSADDSDEEGQVSETVSSCSEQEQMHGHYLPYWKRIMKYSNRITKKAVYSAMFSIVIVGVIVAWMSGDGSTTATSKKGIRTSGEDVEYLIEQSSIDNIYLGAVAADHPTCSEIGLSILKEHDGNAVDAAIATALCLGVVNPSSSGLGGGHFMMVHMNNNVTEFIDSREMAPLASSTHMYDNDTADASLVGGRAVAVWGELRGLQLAHERHGTVPWDVLVQPSISLAEEGIAVNSHLAQSIQSVSPFLLEQPSSVNLKNFLLSTTTNIKRGASGKSSYLKEGDILKQPVLANTLRLIARHGSDVLYEGPLAEAMLKELREEYGGIMTKEDLVQYKPKIREPLVVTHNIMGGDFTFVGAPPPSSGGGAVLGILRMLSGFYRTTNLVVQRNTLAQHLLIEAMKHAFAIRMSLSDPDFATASTSSNDSRSNSSNSNKAMEAIYDMAYSGYMEFLRKNYTRYDKVLPLHLYGGPKWSLLSSSEDNTNSTYMSDISHENANRRRNHRRRMRLFNYLEDHGTTHFSIVDKHRNAVSLSSTVNTEFGSGIWLKSAGIVLNNEMDDFATPGRPNTFGLAPAEANYIQPGKRPLSSMSPTMVFHNSDSDLSERKLFLVLGASGGPRIITAVTQVVINFMVFGMGLKDSVAHPRVHDQLLYNGRPSTLYDKNVTKAGFEMSEVTIQSLLRRGHNLIPTTYSGTCQAIAIDIETNEIEAVSDLRKGGVPAGY